MAGYRDRLQQAVETYRALQSDEEGGWGEDRWEGAACSIVNTAEVLCVFKAANVPYDDPAIQRALGFLAGAVEAHPRSTRQGGRGQHARYCAFGVLGLTLFKESRHDVRWEEAQGTCVEWLRDHRVADAWPEHAGNEHPSLTSTHAAVVGLSRICPRHDLGPQATVLAAEAQQAVLSLGQQRGRRRCWANTPEEEDKVSPAATALAVLTLSKGNAKHRKAAIEGAKWLLAHVDDWAGATEGDAHMRDANWRQMSFSLCLRATLTPPAAHSATEPALKGSIEYLDSLWNAREREWRHGHPEARCSPTGSCSVVLASEAVRRAWPLELEFPRAKPRRAPRSAAKPETRIAIAEDWSVSASDLRGELVAAERLSPKLGFLLAIVARRLFQAGTDAPLEARTLTAAELASACGWKDLDTVRRNAGRVNDVLSEAAKSNNRGLGDLLQPMGDPPTPAERRWGLNVGDVRLDDWVLRATEPA